VSSGLPGADRIKWRVEIQCADGSWVTPVGAAWLGATGDTEAMGLARFDHFRERYAGSDPPVPVRLVAIRTTVTRWVVAP